MTEQIHAAFRVDVAAPLRAQYGLNESARRVSAILELPHPDDYVAWVQTVAERHVLLGGPETRPQQHPMGRNYWGHSNQDILRWATGGALESRYLGAFTAVKTALDREKRARTRGVEFNAQAVRHLFGAARLIADSRQWMEESERQARSRSKMTTEHPL